MSRRGWAVGLFCLLAAVAALVALFGKSCGWDHSVSTVFEGTKSEGKVATLSFAGKDLLPYFPEVVTPIGDYKYKFRGAPWWPRPVAGGWMRQSTPRPKPAKLKERVSSQELQQGWYTCDEGHKKSRTPSHWFWVPSLGAWIAPSRVNDFVQKQYHRNGWAYEIQVRDEGNWQLRGYLTYEGDEITLSVTHIATPIGTYRWAQSSACESGWLVEDPRGFDKYPSEGEPLDEETVAAGWYEGTMDHPGRIIPNGWVFLPDDGLWIDPRKTERYLEHIKTPVQQSDDQHKP